jgi:multicomponent Na+:H+ antiporter subunit E
MTRAAWSRRAVLDVGIRIALAAVAWWAFTDGDWRTAPIAVVSVLASVAASVVVLPPTDTTRVRALGVARFIPYFLVESILGGIDVLRRSIDPRLPVTPGFVEVELRLPAGPARIVFAATVSLLPGTLSARLGERELLIHALATDTEVLAGVRRLEERVADVFGCELPSERSASDG